MAAAKTSADVSPSHELEAADLVPQVRNVPSWLDPICRLFNEANKPKPSLTDIGMGYTLWNPEGDGDGLSARSEHAAVFQRRRPSHHE